MSYNNIITRTDEKSKAAADYARRGYLVFPLYTIKDGRCTCGDADCPSPGKHPLTINGFKNATTNTAMVEAWWKRRPEANIGLATGRAAGFFVLDVDGPEGEETLRSLEKTQGTLPPTVTVITGNGKHFYFKYPINGEIKNKTKFAPGLDTRGEGGYVVAPPSDHVSGRRYEWLVSPEETGITEAPSWLVEFIGRRSQCGTGPRVVEDDWEVDVLEGERNDALTRRAGKLFAAKMPANEVLETLLSWNERHCKPPLKASEVRGIVESIAKKESAKPRGGKGKGRVKRDGESENRQGSFFVNDQVMAEQIYRDGQSLFLVFNHQTEKREVVPYFKLGDEVVEPIKGDDVELGAIKLPSGIEEYGESVDLIREAEGHIYRYLDVSAAYLKFAAYYVLLSWVYDRFHTVPYLRALGDTGCGKSRFLDVIGGLCYKPVSASGCVTPAPIYRMLRKWGGTLVLDEMDMKNSDEYNEVVTILNCGFERGRPVIRATKDNPDKIQILPVFGPKVFATRRRFKDAALEARCLTEIMEETSRNDIPPVLGRRFYEEQEALRNKLLLFRFRNYRKIDPEKVGDVDLQKIEPRLRQVSEAFLSLFANDGGALAGYKEFILGHQRELIEQRALTKHGQIVEALLAAADEAATYGYDGYDGYDYMGLNVINVTAGDIAAKVEMTPQAVGQILKNLGLRTYPLKVYGKTKKLIVHDKDRFEKLRKRYIPVEVANTLEREMESTPCNLQEKKEGYDVSIDSPANVTNVTIVTAQKPVEEWPTCRGCNRKVPEVSEAGLCDDCAAIYTRQQGGG